jgi:hypothetical protein
VRLRDLHTPTRIDAQTLQGGKDFLARLDGPATRSFVVVAAATQRGGDGAGQAVVTLKR